LPDGTTYLRWRGLFEFLISRDGQRIHYRRLDRATRESFSVYLLGQALSCSLLAFGAEPLHGTVVVIDGHAIALVGDCGRGKSTLAAAFLARGFRILTDDVMVVAKRRGGWVVQPGIPRLKLFPAAAAALLGERAKGRPMNHATTKVVLPLGAGEIVGHPVPLTALYVLSEPVDRTRGRSLAVRVEPLSDRQAFFEVIRAAFNLFVLDRSRFANQFAFANRIVATVPVRRLIYPRRFSSLPAVCDAILGDVAGLTPQAPPLQRETARLPTRPGRGAAPLRHTRTRHRPSGSDARIAISERRDSRARTSRLVPAASSHAPERR
jgi:hypothetical protein